MGGGERKGRGGRKGRIDTVRGAVCICVSGEREGGEGGREGGRIETVRFLWNLLTKQRFINAIVIEPRYITHFYHDAHSKENFD